MYKKLANFLEPKCKIRKKPPEIWENVFSKQVFYFAELFKSIWTLIKIQKKSKLRKASWYENAQRRRISLYDTQMQITAIGS
jgi:hypothetical protein